MVLIVGPVQFDGVPMGARAPMVPGLVPLVELHVAGKDGIVTDGADKLSCSLNSKISLLRDHSFVSVT